MPDQSQIPPPDTPKGQGLDGKQSPDSPQNLEAKLLEKVETLAEQIKLATSDIKLGKEDLQKGKEDIKATKDIVYFGFIILLFMFGLSIIQSWDEKTRSNMTLIDKVDSLQTQLKLLEQSNN